ncbi:MAG: zinc-ribbon domain-containing protein, partial [Chloroflexota bacterium]|nr:zinc-ribbon domain-containing protein [Chloroflexota bacterium]
VVGGPVGAAVGAGIGGAVGAGAGGAADNTMTATTVGSTMAPATVGTVETPPCRNCGAPLRPGATFCTRCGTPVAAEPLTTCPNCGNTVDAEDVFCPHCGNRLVRPAAAAAAMPVAPAAPVMPAVAPVDTAVEAVTVMADPVAPVVTDMGSMNQLPLDTAAAPMPVGAQEIAPLAVSAPVAGTAPFPAEGVAGVTGTGQPRLELLQGGAVIPLPDKDDILVGREDPLSEPPIFPDVDMTPYGGEEGGVSRRHARIIRRDGDYLIEDLQSTNYSKLNGARLLPRTPSLLVDGSRIDFGKIGVIFHR